MIQAAAPRWLLLIHHLPPKPDYLRVKVRRRLQRLGAVLFKSSVYVLPARSETLEDFQWLLNEIVADGGDATIFSATALSGVADEDVEELFRHEREGDYRAIIEEARSPGTDDPAARLGRLRRRLGEVERIDWFDAPAREEAARAVEALGRTSARPAGPAARATVARPDGATWVTRRGVFVDRIASAWLIRRRIDPAARFRFVDPERHRPKAGELRFDMYGGEFTHEGDRCTFETLLVRFALDEPALAAIGEIVHDIDCKDGKFGREEAPGIAAVLEGIALATRNDEERLARGLPLFDGLYERLSRAAS